MYWCVLILRYILLIIHHTLFILKWIRLLLNNEYTDIYVEYKFSQALVAVPMSLRLLLESLFVGKNADHKVAALGQAIVQQIRPKALLCPMPLALGILLHKNFASKFLNETMHAMGFSCSYKEVCKFERNAAVASLDVSSLLNGFFVQV